MIGIFDSGLGGLSAMKEARKLMPSTDIVYFGDTGRVPYGTRSKEIITKYALQDMRFLLTYPIDAVLVACGTVSSTALDTLKSNFDIPILGVVDATAECAVKSTKNKTVGVIATGATISSRSFENKIHEIDPSVKVISTPCPLLVPLVENGYTDDGNQVVHLVLEQYLKDIKKSGADTLILGCTHFPLISGAIAKVLPGVTLINSGAEAAKQLQKLTESKFGKEKQEHGISKYFVSDNPSNFENIAELFLEKSIKNLAEKIDIEKY